MDFQYEVEHFIKKVGEKETDTNEELRQQSGIRFGLGESLKVLPDIENSLNDGTNWMSGKRSRKQVPRNTPPEKHERRESQREF